MQPGRRHFDEGWRRPLRAMVQQDRMLHQARLNAPIAVGQDGPARRTLHRRSATQATCALAEALRRQRVLWRRRSSVSIYPLIVAIVSLAFGVIVLSQWMARRRSQQLIWAIALLMAAGASFAFVGFLSVGSELLFRVYYALGALLMAAYLGMGSLYLALSKRAADLILAALVIVSALGVALILVAPMDVAALHS